MSIHFDIFDKVLDVYSATMERKGTDREYHWEVVQQELNLIGLYVEGNDAVSFHKNFDRLCENIHNTGHQIIDLLEPKIPATEHSNG